MIKKSDILSI